MAVGSSLATLHMWSPNHYNGRKYSITKLTIHHVAGKLKAATIGNIFLNPSRKASSTYGIGYDGEIAQYVDEADAPWTSSNYDNDNRAITFEVSNSATGGDWPVSDAALESLIKLCVDCVQRNPGIKEINFTGDKTGNLTMHKWFAATACPGPYLESKFQYIAEEINRRLGTTEKVEAPETPVEKPEATVLYRVQVGAYTKLVYAQAQAQKVTAAGFATYLVKADDGLYKVQAGAYAKAANAQSQVAKLKAAGFNAFVTTKSGTPVKGDNETSGTITLPGTASTADDVKDIIAYLKAKGFSVCGVYGILANLIHESSLRSNNLQNVYNTKSGMTDEAYTAAVDNGSYTKFVTDSYGYGLCQWTYHTRKKALYEFARAAKMSIADWRLQLDFMCKELDGYSSLTKLLHTTTSVAEAARAFMCQFERPADQSEAAQARRARTGQEYYDKYEAPVHEVVSLCKGDRVKLTADATYTDGRSIPTWVFSKKLYVRQIYTSGDVVVSTLATGAVTGVVARKHLIKI